jgi:hypothetical protein
MPHIYTKVNTLITPKKKKSKLKDSSIDFILKYSSSVQAISVLNGPLFFIKN